MTRGERHQHIEALQQRIESNRTESIEDKQTLAEYCLDNQLSQKLVNSLYNLLLNSKRLATEEAQREEEPIVEDYQNLIIDLDGTIREMMPEEVIEHILEPVEDMYMDDLIEGVVKRGLKRRTVIRTIDKLLRRCMIAYRVHGATNRVYLCWRVEDIAYDEEQGH